MDRYQSKSGVDIEADLTIWCIGEKINSGTNRLECLFSRVVVSFVRKQRSIENERQRTIACGRVYALSRPEQHFCDGRLQFRW